VVGSSIPRATHEVLTPTPDQRLAWRAQGIYRPTHGTEYDCPDCRTKKKGLLPNKSFMSVSGDGEHSSEVEKALKLNAKIQVIADEFRNASNFIYWAWYNFPVALEGALN